MPCPLYPAQQLIYSYLKLALRSLILSRHHSRIKAYSVVFLELEEIMAFRYSKECEIVFLLPPFFTTQLQSLKATP